MRKFLFKFLCIAGVTVFLGATPYHPIFVSVLNIEQNAKSNSLEVSCKIFTDDFEKALRKTYHTHIDLLDANAKASMDKYINDYVQRHLKIYVNSNTMSLKMLGFEQEEEGIICFFETGNIGFAKNITITDNILYEFETQQMGLIHCTLNGNTQHYKLNNPEDRADFKF